MPLSTPDRVSRTPLPTAFGRLPPLPYLSSHLRLVRAFESPDAPDKRGLIERDISYGGISKKVPPHVRWNDIGWNGRFYVFWKIEVLPPNVIRCGHRQKGMVAIHDLVLVLSKEVFGHDDRLRALHKFAFHHLEIDIAASFQHVFDKLKVQRHVTYGQHLLSKQPQR